MNTFPSRRSQEMAPFHTAGGDAAAFPGSFLSVPEMAAAAPAAAALPNDLAGAAPRPSFL